MPAVALPGQDQCGHRQFGERLLCGQIGFGRAAHDVGYDTTVEPLHGVEHRVAHVREIAGEDLGRRCRTAHGDERTQPGGADDGCTSAVDPCLHAPSSPCRWRDGEHQSLDPLGRGHGGVQGRRRSHRRSAEYRGLGADAVEHAEHVLGERSPVVVVVNEGGV